MRNASMILVAVLMVVGTSPHSGTRLRPADQRTTGARCRNAEDVDHG